MREFESAAAVREKYFSPKKVGSRLGENLDVAGSQGVEFGRKGILIDADFADSVFTGQSAVAGGESVDENLPSVGASGRSGERHQIRDQIVGVVCDRVQIVAAHHLSRSALSRIGAHDRCDGVGHGDLLAFQRQAHLDIEYRRSRIDVHGRGISLRESGRGGFYGIHARRQSGQDIRTVIAGRGGQRLAPFAGGRDGGSGNRCSRLIGDRASKNTSGLGRKMERKEEDQGCEFHQRYDGIYQSIIVLAFSDGLS